MARSQKGLLGLSVLLFAGAGVFSRITLPNRLATIIGLFEIVLVALIGIGFGISYLRQRNSETE